MTGVAIGTAKLTARVLAPELGAGVTISQDVRVRYQRIRITSPVVQDSIQGLGTAQNRTATVFGVNSANANVAPVALDSLKSRDTTVFRVSGTTISARRNGTAQLVAFFDGFRDSVAVRVRQVAGRITFPTTDYTARHLNFNLTVPLTVRDVTDSLIPTPTLTWRTKDTTRATVGAATGVLRVKLNTTDTVWARMDTVERAQRIAVAQVAASMTKVPGADARSDTVAKNVTVVPTVTVLDSGLTPIVGASVVFRAGLGTNATVQDTLQVTDVNGRARPTNWKLGDFVGTNNNTLTATSGAAATTFTVTAIAGQPKKLGFLVQPTSATLSASIAPAIQVQVQDSLGNVVTTATNTVTLSLSNNPSAATLGGTLAVAAVNGIATFSNISLNLFGSGYTLQASSGALAPVISNGIDIYGVKTKLAFTTQPSTTTAGATMPTVRVTIQDAANNRVATATDSVTIAIGTNPATGTLSGTLKVAAVAGVATFSNLSINNAATGYTLSTTATGLTTAASTAFNVAAVGPASKLVFVSQPSNVVSGVAISPSFAVQVQDAGGALVTSSVQQVTLSIDPTTNPTGLATVSGTPTVTAVGGIATFSNVIVNRAGTGYRLIATATGTTLTTSTSSTFNVTAGTANRLGFSQQPTHTVAAATMSPTVVVEVQDANGNRVTTGSSVAVSLALSTCTATLTGGGTANTTNGIATYSGLSVGTAVTGCTLTATASAAGLIQSVSTAFNSVAAGGAVKLKFTTQPASATAGIALNAGTVAFQDANNANATISVSTLITISVASGPTTTINAGSTSQSTTTSVAFSSVTFNTAGTYQLVASATGYRPDTSAAFVISPAAAARTNVIVQPVNTVAGVPFTAVIQAAVQDQFNNTVTTATNVISMAAFSQALNLTLQNGTNTMTATAVNGVATFSGLAVRKAGTAVILCTSATALSGFCSSTSFNVAAAPLSTLGFTVQPAAVTAGTAFSSSIQVSGQDSVGNTITDFTSPVTLNVTGGTTGAALSGTRTQNPVAGIATFPGLSVDRAGTGYQLIASASGVSTGTSGTFTVNAGAAAKLTWTTQPAATTFLNAPLSANASAPAVVSIQDALGNPVTSASASVTFTLTSGPTLSFKSGGSSVTSVTTGTSSGMVNLTSPGFQMGTVGTGYLMQAFATGLTSATSTVFAVSAFDVKSSLAFAQNPTNVLMNTAIAPAVTVQTLDQWGNIVTNVTSPVTLTIGTDANPTTILTGGGATTPASGVATFGSLSLNKAGAGYRLAAGAAGVTTAQSSTFTVTDPCATLTTHTLGTTSNGSLASGDCITTSNERDKFSLTTTVPTTFFSATVAASFNPTLQSFVWPTGASLITAATTTSVTHYVLAKAGAWQFDITKATGQPLGTYSFSTVVNPPQPAGCHTLLVTQGISATQTLSTSCTATHDAASTANPSVTVSAREYYIFQPAGTAITVKMNAGTMVDPFLEAFEANGGAFIAFNDDISTGVFNSQLTIPGSSGGRYVLIRASHHSTGTGSGTFTLIVDP